MDTYEGYLGALGFNGQGQGQAQNPVQQGTSFAQSDAARRQGDVQRQLAAARADLGLAGEEERSGINADWEERGMFKSSARGQALAQQQGREASKAAMLEAGAAADMGNINADMQRQMASEQAGAQADAADQQLSQMQLQYMRDQMAQNTGPNSIAAQQLALAKAQFEAQKQLWAKQLELAQKTSAGTDS